MTAQRNSCSTIPTLCTCRTDMYIRMDAKSLTKFANDMSRCEMTLSHLGYTAEIINTATMKSIFNRFRFHMNTKWTEYATGIIKRAKEATFKHLVTFVQQRVETVQHMGRKPAVVELWEKHQTVLSQDATPTVLPFREQRSPRKLVLQNQLVKHDHSRKTQATKISAHFALVSISLLNALHLSRNK